MLIFVFIVLNNIQEYFIIVMSDLISLVLGIFSSVIFAFDVRKWLCIVSKQALSFRPARAWKQCEIRHDQTGYFLHFFSTVSAKALMDSSRS